MKAFLNDLGSVVLVYSIIYFSCLQVFRWATLEGCPAFRTAGGKQPLRDLMDLIRP